MNVEWLYQNNTDNTCRYILGTVGNNPLICVGVNPSTAEPNKLDNTLRSVNRIATQNEYDSWIMLNLYPQRATNPNDLSIDAKFDIMDTNNIFIREILKKYSGADIWAAWGTLIEKRHYLHKCLVCLDDSASEYGCNWVSYGPKSKRGHPHHPLYLKSTSQKEPFNLVAYQKILQTCGG